LQTRFPARSAPLFCGVQRRTQALGCWALGLFWMTVKRIFWLNWCYYCYLILELNVSLEIQGIIIKSKFILRRRKCKNIYIVTYIINIK
jgi:hypothetical protein